MKKSVLLFVLVALLAVALSACGALIPAQHFDNPVGLQGQKVSVSVTGSSATSEPTALIPLATGSGEAHGSFGNIDLSKLPSGISISKYQIALGFEGTATVTVPGGSLPPTINLTDVMLNVNVSDSGSTATVPTMTYDGTLTLTQESGQTYTVTGSETIDQGKVNQIFNDVLSSGDLAPLLEVVTQDGSNTATATLTFQTNDLPTGSTVDLTFSAGTATVHF